MLAGSIVSVCSVFSGLLHVWWEIKEDHKQIDRNVQQIAANNILIAELKNTCASSKTFQKGAYTTERYNTQLIKNHLKSHK